jgi:hypothetical protein
MHTHTHIEGGDEEADGYDNAEEEDQGEEYSGEEYPSSDSEYDSDEGGYRVGFCMCRCWQGCAHCVSRSRWFLGTNGRSCASAVQGCASFLLGFNPTAPRSTCVVQIE